MTWAMSGSATTLAAGERKYVASRDVGNGTIETRGFYGTFGGPGSSRFDHHGHLQMTNVAEFQTSYERQINALSALSLTLVRRKTRRNDGFLVSSLSADDVELIVVLRATPAGYDIQRAA